MQTARCLGLLLVVLLHGAAHAAGRPKLTPANVKSPAYNPGLWNSTCKYSAHAIPPAQFFRGQEYADKSMLVPLHADSPTAAAFKYPINACFGPGERYDQAKVAPARSSHASTASRATSPSITGRSSPAPAPSSPTATATPSTAPPAATASPAAPRTSAASGPAACSPRPSSQTAPHVSTPPPSAPSRPRGTHYIAAAIAPEASQQGNDFHLWRRDANGAWSWKAGFTFGRNSYRNGTLVRDLPDPSIRRMYPVFCGYFDVSSKTHKLHASPGGTRSTLPARFEAWKRAGWRTRVTRLAAWSRGWYGQYQYVYVGQSYGDVAYGQQAAATRRRKGTYSAELEAWRSQPEATVALTRTRTRRQGRG